MLRHVVMFRWADDVGADRFAELGSALDALPGQIDVLRNYVHGPDAGITDGNFDYVIVADVDSPEDFATYRDHPDHVAMIQNVLAGMIAERCAVQYVIPDD